MKTFRLNWLDGKTEDITGNTISEAFTMAGYGAGALKVLNSYKEISHCVACNEVIKGKVVEIYNYTLCEECNNPV